MNKTNSTLAQKIPNKKNPFVSIVYKKINEKTHLQKTSFAPI